MKKIIQYISVIALGLILGKSASMGYSYMSAPKHIEQGNYQKYFKGKNSQHLILGTSWCKFCDSSKKLFDEINVKYTFLDIETNHDAKNIYNELNGKGFPIILIGNTRINGFNEPAIIKAISTTNQYEREQ